MVQLSIHLLLGDTVVRPSMHTFIESRTSVFDVTAAYVRLFILTLVFMFFLNLFWGDMILVNFNELLGTGYSTEGLRRVMFIFIWGFCATVFFSILSRGFTYSRMREVLHGWWVSLNAGIFEELIYRWILFFTAMIMIPFFNWITLGLVKWLYTEFLVPLANFATLHALDSQLHDPRSWVIGAAIVSAAAKFRNGHKYLGLIGWVNSWFIGMVMFWLVFNYGLLTAIVAHVVYDVVVFTTESLLKEKI